MKKCQIKNSTPTKIPYKEGGIYHLYEAIMMGMLATLTVVDTLLTALAFSMCSKKELHVHAYTVIVYSRKSLTQMKRRLFVSSENNLPMFD